MKTNEQIAKSIIRSTGIEPEKMIKDEVIRITKMILDYEKEIRQNQKEKCAKAVQGLKFGSIHPQHAINSIMEADQEKLYAIHKH